MISRNLSLSRLLLIACALLMALGATGCVHRIGIQQGNFLQAKDIDRVNVGMTRVQVRALLGTPMIADPFHQSRWDYYFYLKMGRWKQPMQRHFIVYFDPEDKVERIERRGVNTDTTVPAEAEDRTALPSTDEAAAMEQQMEDL